MCGWSFISRTEGSLPWDALKSRSQALISARRAATSIGRGRAGQDACQSERVDETRDKSKSL